MLGGGITNHNLRARYGGRDVVVRLAGKDTGAARASTASASARRPPRRPPPASGPRSSPSSTSPPTLVTEFLPGRVMTQADLGKPDMIAEVAVTLWEVHGMPAAPQPLLGLGRGRPLRAHRGGARRRRARARSATCARARAGSRPRSTRRIPSTRRCRATTTCCRRTSSTTARRSRIVDWEYAGMGNRYFDLGNLSVNNELQRGRRRVAARVLLGRAAARAGGWPRCG